MLTCTFLVFQGIVQKLAATQNRAALLGDFAVRTGNNLISSTGEKLITRKKVREILFEGYHVKLFEELASYGNNFGVEIKSPLPNNTFGAFYNKNGTSPGQYAINTGTMDIMSLGQIQTFKSRP